MKQEPISIAERLPKPDWAVVVISKTSRCLGCLDRDGEWRDWKSKQRLEEVVGWFALEDDWW